MNALTRGINLSCRAHLQHEGFAILAHEFAPCALEYTQEEATQFGPDLMLKVRLVAASSDA